MTNWEKAVDMRAVGRFLVRGTRRAALTVVGFALVVVGIAGLVLPILPGWALIISGFVVLSREYSWANSALRFARRHAARGGQGIRTLFRRVRSRPAVVALPADDVLIDLRQGDGDGVVLSAGDIDEVGSRPL
jgi:hypothetical protein